MTETLTPHQTVLIKAHKQSARARWQDHFTLQLRSRGFVIHPAGAKNILVRNGDQTHVTDKDVFPEFQFHHERKWRFDFAIPAKMIAIEIEGGIWMRGGGAHSRPMNIMRDVEKSNAATMLGWRLLRFTDKEIRAGTSIEMTAALAMR